MVAHRKAKAIVIAIIALSQVLYAANTALTEPFILGADISWIPEREASGIQYSDNGVQKDIFEILKDHRFNYIRLRIFHNPAATGGLYEGYSRQGFCDLEHTKAMALRIKSAGMKFLLDFHYSDTWADPGKQYKPHAWEGLSFAQLTDSVREYTRNVLTELKDQGTLPDMVQIGNEIVGGMIWPDGRSSTMTQFAALVKAGIDGVKEVDSSVVIAIHSVSENSPSSWLQNLIRSDVTRIDVFGLSYYSEWHGTPDNLKRLLDEVAGDHEIKIAVMEYADNHRRVNDIVHGLPDNRGIGTFVWEPTDWRETLFNLQGNIRATNARIDLYPQMSKDYGNDDTLQVSGTPLRRAHTLTTISAVRLTNRGMLRFNVHKPGLLEIALYSLSGQSVWCTVLQAGIGMHTIRIEAFQKKITSRLYVVSVKRLDRTVYKDIVSYHGK